MSIYLTIGACLFGLTHLYPAIFVTSRQMLIGKIGIGPYKGIYSIFILLSLFMIIFGWRQSNVENIYMPPVWGHLATVILMYPALFLFISARAGGNIKRIIRHPQLSSIVLWGFAHLLSNGEGRSVILFGIFAVWALTQMFFLNRRDNVWKRPEAFSLFHDIKVTIITLVVYGALLYSHGYFTGISLTL